jgi:uncharacterized membrane protein YphA (DoxX/SURF4 family)
MALRNSWGGLVDRGLPAPGMMGLRWLVAFLVIMAESFGSLALIAGFLTRFTAASFLLICSEPLRRYIGPTGSS